MPFTDKQISALKPKAVRYEKKEPGRSGLSIRVTPRGAKTWTFVYRHGDMQRRMALGQYPAMGVAAAHKALADAREQLRDGVDPGILAAAERKAEREAETLEELVDEYVAVHGPTMKKSTATEDERLLRREILSDKALANSKAKDVRRRDLILRLREIELRGAPVLRNRVAGVLSRLFVFALDQGVIEASPAVGIKRLEESPRDRFLSVAEIRAFWNSLDAADMSPQTRLALRLALVLGQRRAEMAGTARCEIDDRERLWHIPGSRTKNGRDNFMPLPPMAMRLIAEADTLRVRPKTVRDGRRGAPPYDPTPSPWLFPSWHRGKPLEPAALTRALNRNRAALGIGDATVHDLRRTFATYHGELGTPPEILSGLLNHAPKSITEQVYNRATNIEPRRKAMDVWCAWLERVISGEAVAENVVPLRKAQ